MLRIATSLCLSAALLVSAVASTMQIPDPTSIVKIGLRVRIGYGFSNDVDGFAGRTVRFEGPQLGLDIPLLNLVGTEIALSPSYFGGGRLQAGTGDDDAEVYRFLLTATRRLPNNLSVTGGFGIGHSIARSRTFDGDNGLVGMIGGGYPIEGLLRGRDIRFELQFFLSGRDTLQGYYFGLSALL